MGCRRMGMVSGGGGGGGGGGGDMLGDGRRVSTNPTAKHE